MATQRVPLAIANLADSTDTASQALLVELLNSKLTYGAFALKRRDLATFANDTLARIDAELRKETDDSRFKANQIAIEAQRNALLQQKIANDQAIQQQQVNIQQRQVNAERLNTTKMQSTNCSVSGSNISCLTW